MSCKSKLAAYAIMLGQKKSSRFISFFFLLSFRVGLDGMFCVMLFLCTGGRLNILGVLASILCVGDAYLFDGV